MAHTETTDGSGSVSDDVIGARDAPNFSIKHKALRALFSLVWTLTARWTPPQMRRWRLFILKLFGAKLHSTASVRGGAKIWYPPNLEMAAHSVLADGVNCYNMAKILIGEGTIVSQGAFLCGGTHDFRLGSNPLQTRPILLGPRVWIAAEAFVAPGTEVPEGCVIGARAVVFGTLSSWSVYSGNPAKRIKTREFNPNA